MGPYREGVLEPYREVCWDHTERCVETKQRDVLGPYREGVLGPYRGQVSALNRMQKRAATFENNINESGWEIWVQRRMIARIFAHFKAYAGKRAWKAIRDRLLKPCYLSRDDHNRKIRTKNRCWQIFLHK